MRRLLRVAAVGYFRPVARRISEKCLASLADAKTEPYRLSEARESAAHCEGLHGSGRFDNGKRFIALHQSPENPREQIIARSVGPAEIQPLGHAPAKPLPPI